MSIYKVNYFFELKKRGWSETYYTADLATPEDALQRALRVRPFRVRLLARPDGLTVPRMSEVRVSDITIQRDSLVSTVSEADGGNLAGPLGDCAPINVALLCRLQAGSLYRRQLYLRGIPKRIIDATGDYLAEADFTRNADAFFRALIANGMGIYVWIKPGGVFTPLKAIINVANVAGVVTLTTPAHGLADNDQVRVQSAPGTRGVRGNWHIHVIDGNSFSLVGAPPFTGAYIGGGLYYKRTQNTIIFTDGVVEDITHHDTGRPFDSPRGRRKRRVVA